MLHNLSAASADIIAIQTSDSMLLAFTTLPCGLVFSVSAKLWASSNGSTQDSETLALHGLFQSIRSFGLRVSPAFFHGG